MWVGRSAKATERARDEGGAIDGKTEGRKEGSGAGGGRQKLDNFYWLRVTPFPFLSLPLATCRPFYFALLNASEVITLVLPLFSLPGGFPSSLRP